MSKDRFRKQMNSNYTLQDLLKGQDLEIIAASLLLLDKLKVNSVQLFRNSPEIIVTLAGNYQTTDNDKTNMDEFLKANGDLTFDEVLDALNTQLKKKRK
ncbi:hypothetical protein [Paenisporosarcina sp. TG20]|uniref:hypothetical protein n=1 Tax=Paenisporosarcina sp. TG20 TaxID=1211706 RepID=UPI0002E77551|nr:hypothetical protein [Paenisporosarcina sp. TG20]